MEHDQRFTFKIIFGSDTNDSKKILMNLINSILRLEGNQRIIHLGHMNVLRKKKYMNDKASILDIYVKTGTDEHLNIEMQITHHDNYLTRSLFYWSVMFGEQLDMGKDYDSLQKTIGIHLLDFLLYPDEKEAHHVHHIYNHRHEKVTDKEKLFYHLLSQEKAERDRISLLNQAERHGLEAGMAEGQSNIIHHMASIGKSIDEISELTGIERNTVQSVLKG